MRWLTFRALGGYAIVGVTFVASWLSCGGTIHTQVDANVDGDASDSAACVYTAELYPLDAPCMQGLGVMESCLASGDPCSAYCGTENCHFADGSPWPVYCGCQ